MPNDGLVRLRDFIIAPIINTSCVLRKQFYEFEDVYSWDSNFFVIFFQCESHVIFLIKIIFFVPVPSLLYILSGPLNKFLRRIVFLVVFFRNLANVIWGFLDILCAANDIL